MAAFAGGEEVDIDWLSAEHRLRAELTAIT